jgi:hypothetical protein
MLISVFRKWKGLHYVPQIVHPAIRWNSKDVFLEPEIEDLKWNIIKKVKVQKKETKIHEKLFPTMIQAALSVSSNLHSFKSLKRKSSIEDKSANKKIKNINYSHSDNGEIEMQIANPLGIRWSNNSCAYDSVFSILFSLWKSNSHYWTRVLCDINDGFFLAICSGFRDVLEGNNT